MYAGVRKYKVDPTRMGEVSRRIEEGFTSRISELPGFGAHYVVDAGNGILIAVTVGDEGAIEQAAELAVEFVRDELSDLGVERVEAASGEVTVSATA